MSNRDGPWSLEPVSYCVKTACSVLQVNVSFLMPCFTSWALKNDYSCEDQRGKQRTQHVLEPSLLSQWQMPRSQVSRCKWATTTVRGVERALYNKHATIEVIVKSCDTFRKARFFHNFSNRPVPRYRFHATEHADSPTPQN